MESFFHVNIKRVDVYVRWTNYYNGKFDSLYYVFSSLEQA